MFDAWDLRFSQQRCWRCNSCAMWRRVVRRFVPEFRRSVKSFVFMLRCATNQNTLIFLRCFRNSCTAPFFSSTGHNPSDTSHSICWCMTLLTHVVTDYFDVPAFTINRGTMPLIWKCTQSRSELTGSESRVERRNGRGTATAVCVPLSCSCCTYTCT